MYRVCNLYFNHLRFFFQTKLTFFYQLLSIEFHFRHAEVTTNIWQTSAEMILTFNDNSLWVHIYRENYCLTMENPSVNHDSTSSEARQQKVKFPHFLTPHLYTLFHITLLFSKKFQLCMVVPVIFVYVESLQINFHMDYQCKLMVNNMWANRCAIGAQNICINVKISLNLRFTCIMKTTIFFFNMHY